MCHVVAQRIVDEEPTLIAESHGLPLAWLADDKTLWLILLNHVPCPFRRRRFFLNSAHHHQTTRSTLGQPGHGCHETRQRPFGIDAATAVQQIPLLAHRDMAWDRVNVPEQNDLALSPAPDAHRVAGRIDKGLVVAARPHGVNQVHTGRLFLGGGTRDTDQFP